MKINHAQWMRRNRSDHTDEPLTRIELSIVKRDRDDTRTLDMLGEGGPTHVQCDCCGKHALFTEDNPYKGSGWVQSDLKSYYKPGEHPAFEVDLCKECAESHDLSEFDHLPRSGCEWSWKRLPVSELVKAPNGDGWWSKECFANSKVCTKCDGRLGKEAFNSDSRRADGLDPICKECRRQARRSDDARERDAARKRAERRGN